MMGEIRSIIDKITLTERIEIKSGKWKTLSWFLLANAAILLSLAIISGGALIGIFPFVLLASCTLPFISLCCSRWMAKRVHQMYIVDQEHFQSDSEHHLFTLVEMLSMKAGLGKTPQVGMYRSDDINAFATGVTRNRSLVAFSSAILEKMDEEALAAVAAHEIAHIANGDMLTLTLVQSVINSVVMLCTLPLQLLEWFSRFSEQGSRMMIWVIALTRHLLTVILIFLGSLLVKAFSRHREFKADHLAAQLLDRHAMISALEYLKHQPQVTLPNQKAYAAFKIHTTRSWLDILSTHPSIDRRIEALRNL
ncbi:zinc metalloprotease HtpX [Paenibacillus sp. FSL R7-0337]|uniref:zinc metalloprotease HtpX n=1 Tax=Paenibacillus sp. FSL R7-0337 TaxID=1926588 RepID=UPI0009F93BD1|nr:zinc metalloprotease HtpX [Paenibacillus sp. FSL R7-0337]